MPTLTFETITDYTNFGFTVQNEGSYVGPTSGTGSGTGYEPAEFIIAEEGGPTLGVQRNWISPNLAGNSNSPIVGDGAGNPLSEIAVEMNFRVVTPIPGSLGFNRRLFNIGVNDGGVDSANVRLEFQQSGKMAVAVGDNAAGAGATVAVFEWTHPVRSVNQDMLWHKLRIEYEQAVAGTFDSAADKFDIYFDDTLETPDSFSPAAALGNFNNANEHYIVIGGLDNASSWDFEIGNVLMSSSSSGSFNTAPTGSYNSITQR